MTPGLPGRSRTTGLVQMSQAWAEVLGGLRTDELPEGEELPLDLSPLVAAAVAQVSDPRGWEALCAQQARREPLEVCLHPLNLGCPGGPERWIGVPLPSETDRRPAVRLQADGGHGARLALVEGGPRRRRKRPRDRE